MDTEQAAYLKQEKLTQTCGKIEDLLNLFFEEMMRGSLQNQRLVRRMFHLIYPNLSFEQNACFSLTPHIRQNNHFVRNQWAHGRGELSQYINSFASSSSCRIEIRIISDQDDRLFSIRAARVQVSGSARSVIEKDIAALCDGLRTTFGVQINLEGLEVFSSIPAMLSAYPMLVRYLCPAPWNGWGSGRSSFTALCWNREKNLRPFRRPNALLLILKS